MNHKKQKICLFQVFLSFWVFVCLAGESSFAFEESEKPLPLTRKSPVKKGSKVLSGINGMLSSEYALVPSSKLPQEQLLTAKEEEDLLSRGFKEADAFLKLFNFYWSPLVTHASCLQISSVIPGNNPSVNMMFRKDEDAKPLIRMFFIPSYPESACLAVGGLNSSIRSAATFFKTSLEGPIEQIFWKIFFRTLEGVSGESEESLQFYTDLESEDGVRKIVIKHPEKEEALYLEYFPATLK